MALSLHHRNLTKRRPRRFLFLLVTLSLFAVGCGGSDTADTADTASIEPIVTNDGGVLVKPPDVLEGAPEPTPDASIVLPPPVEGLDDTPIVPFEYFDGTLGSTLDFKGRPTVINFWASTCAPCVAEMPEFEEVHQALLGEVDFVGINVADLSRERAVELAEQTGVTYPLIDDPDSKLFAAFKGFAMPTTVLLNPQGQVADVWVGVLTGDALRQRIDDHIAPGSSSDA